MSKAGDILTGLKEEKVNWDSNLIKGIEQLRLKFNPESEDAIYLGIVRDIASALKKGVSITRYIGELEDFGN